MVAQGFRILTSIPFRGAAPLGFYAEAEGCGSDRDLGDTESITQLSAYQCQETESQIVNTASESDRKLCIFADSIYGVASSLASGSPVSENHSMPALTVTVEENTPLLNFSSQWQTGTSLSDVDASLYSESSFITTQTDGASASFTFNGTSVQIYGAKLPDHGSYVVKVDNTTYPTQNGSLPAPGEYQTSLFAVNGLQQGPHTITLTNQGTNFVDIDYISWITDIGGASDQLFVNTIQDTDSSFVYSGSSWNADPNAGRFLDGSAQYASQLYV
ncbi:hypothetical protein H0H93_016460 [Arthromyces matolae]|nr:hypothetical protein H0H93_016460 [Arthromyces matolae]